MLNFCDFIQVNVFTTNHHLKGPHCSISDEIFYCEVSLLVSHNSFIIVNEHDWPTLF